MQSRLIESGDKETTSASLWHHKVRAVLRGYPNGGGKRLEDHLNG